MEEAVLHAGLQRARFRPMRLELISLGAHAPTLQRAPLPTSHRDNCGVCMQGAPIQWGGAAGVHDAVPCYATVCAACTDLQGSWDTVDVPQQDEGDWCLPSEGGACESMRATAGAVQCMCTTDGSELILTMQVASIHEGARS